MSYSEPMNFKQVTVFGGSGFIGRAIVEALAHQGYLVRVACRRIELAEKVKTAGDVGQITLMRTNLRVPESIGVALAGSQFVINAAGIPFQRGKQRYDAVHVAGARAIAEAANAHGVQRLVHISGIGADSRGSKNRYVQSKVEAESAIIAGFDTATILRPSVVFGPGDVLFNRLGKIAALPSWVSPFMPVVGSGKARVQPVFVGDVAAAAVAVLARPDTAKSVIELGGPRVYTYRELAALTLHEIGREKPIIGVPAALMKIGGFFAEFLPVPPITCDQVDLLTHDNIVRPGAKDLASLGISPTAAEIILPTYLDRFRAGGRFNTHAPA